MKTTVRAHVIIPDNYLTIQRLYDDGLSFKLERETKTDEQAADFIEQLIAQGGKLLDAHEFVDDEKIRCITSNFFS